MYIKQIIIQGFKSYKEQTVMEPFSPGTNVVVGRNGSGKSNFFAAIRFVLGDDYNNVGREDRQALLHEGSGSAVMSAYVEIIFDNSDGRFQTPNQEVVIRRTIALKKDEYSLDKKAVPKSEVFDLLEGAGFSRANPYYIVPQGRVTELTNQKESQRLKLLKGIAGTETYDNKRAESQKIMQDTMKRREKIDELLEVITGRLEELEGEKEELRQFQEKDKERRCLEYAYYHQHQEAVQLALSEVEEARQGGASSSKQEQDAFQAGELKVQAIDSEIAELQQEIEILEGERRHLEEDRRAATRIRAKAEMQVKNLDDTRDVRLEAKREHDDTLAEVRRQIRSKEEALAKIAPRFDKLRQEEEDKKKQLDLAEHTLQRLEAKQTRNSQFKNKKERDAYLQKEIASSGDAISAQKAAGMDAQEEVKSLGVAIAKAIADIEDVRGRISSFPEHKEKLIADLNEAREQLERLQEQKKELVRERETLETMHRKTGAGLQKAEGDLKKCMDRSTHEALKNIRELMKKQDIPGAYGMLADLMTVPKESYEVAVDQVAGGSLFSYVTDNEITSGMIGNHLHAIHGGRITFLPLTKLPTRRVKLPRAPDAEPLIPKIAYDAKYDAAFQHVFGRCIVCPNLAVGAQYARSHNLDCVTLDGEKSNKRGALTGGYVDAGRSRLRTARQVAERRATYEEQYERLRAMDEDGQKLTQEITKAASAEHKLAYELERLRGSWRQLNLEKQDKEHELKRLNTQLEKAKEREKTVERHLEELNEIVTSFQTELASEFKKVLSAHEEEQMELLSVQVREHRKQWKEVRAERLKLESQKKKHEIELNTNLRPQEDQLTSQAMEVLVSEDTTSDKDAKKELQKSQKAVVSIERKLKENEDKISKATAGVQQLGAEKAEKEESQQELAARIEKQRKRIEKNMQRKSLLTQQATNHAKSIRDLGVIPEEAFDKYDRMRVDQIESRLRKVNEALKKFQHINKKALEQYSSFTTQREALTKRRKELDAAEDSIKDLIDHLDQAKDEAIERTFKQVSKDFSTIFERLVPAGHGRLVIQRKTDKTGNQAADDSDDEPRRGVENYTGVGISVSFNSKTFDEQQKIQQLSGGQKSLCALCLIFAIQATETSPMVIFDEVDANLDAQYRTAVASLLQSTSRDAGTQFICTTFRPEIVLVADKCYGVTFRNKSSTIDCVPTEDALNFVEGQKK